MTTMDAPIHELFEQLPDGTADGPALERVAAALARFASDLEALAPWIERLGGRSGSIPIHAPVSGPRLQLVHRPIGGMSAVHDHGTWVAVATVTGLETHRRYRWIEEGGTGRLDRIEDRALAACETVVMLPPDDIHDHGHLVGRGAPAYLLVLTGDDQRRYTRSEWDLATGRRRVLQPGEGGRWLASEPMPDA